MTDKTDDTVDTANFTDADWAALNKLRDAHAQGGQKAFSAAMKEIEREALVSYVRIVSAFFPDQLREALKDVMAERGMTAEDLRELLGKSESSSERLQ